MRDGVEEGGPGMCQGKRGRDFWDSLKEKKNVSMEHRG